MGAVVSLATAPLSMAATCCGSLFGSCAASMLCKACSCSCVASNRVTSAIYIVILMTFVGTAWLFKTEGGDIVIGGGSNTTEASILDRAASIAGAGALHYWNDRFYCAPAHPHAIAIICCANTCGGVFAVYRFSFVLCLFFAFLLLCTVGTSRFGARAHRGFWFLKFFTLFGLLIAAIFVDNHAMAAYREVARYASFLFLMMQILLLIDFGYRTNEWLIELDEKSENESCCNWKMGILVGAFLLYAASITMWALEGHYFGGEGCAAQQALIALTVIFCVLLSAVSCTKFCPHGTLLTSAIVTGYASYLCYSALASHPDATCNPFSKRQNSSFSDLAVGFVVFGVSMASTAWSATGSKDALIGKTSPTELTETLEGGPASDGDDSEKVTPESWWYYHLMMTVCTFYMAMLLTDWSTQPVNQPDGSYATSLGTFWVKIGSQWVCLLMYAWTLLAPYLLRDVRDFGIEFDLD